MQNTKQLQKKHANSISVHTKTPQTHTWTTNFKCTQQTSNIYLFSFQKYTWPFKWIRGIKIYQRISRGVDKKKCGARFVKIIIKKDKKILFAMPPIKSDIFTLEKYKKWKKNNLIFKCIIVGVCFLLPFFFCF